MRAVFTMTLGIFFILSLLVGTGFADEMATPQEVVQKVKEAVKLIQDEGSEKAFKIIRDKNGPFVWKNSYVVVTTLNGKMLVHPMVPKLEGREMSRAKDAKGKLFQAEMDNVAKTKGSGWVDYHWVKPGDKKASPKVSFVMAVPGHDIACLAGVYDYTKEEVEKIAQ